MKNMAEKYARNGLTIIAVNVDKDHEAAEKFLGDMSVPFTVVYDSSGTLAELYNLRAMPTSFLYGPDGTLREHHEGFHAKDTLTLDSLVWDLVHEKKHEKEKGGE
jgi:peroxiredoxin